MKTKILTNYFSYCGVDFGQKTGCFLRNFSFWEKVVKEDDFCWKMEKIYYLKRPL